MKLIGKGLASLLILNLLCCFAFAGEEVKMIKKGNKVAFDYTLTVDSAVVDSSKGKKPLEYIQGEGQIIPGLEKEMEGMKVGDEKTVTVASRDAYGEVNPNAFQEVDRSKLPQNIDLKVGMTLRGQNSQGRPAVVKIVEIKDKTVKIDFNHPLAGKILTFQVKVVSIE